jgi:hypothetical protein
MYVESYAELSGFQDDIDIQLLQGDIEVDTGMGTMK